MHGRSLVCGVDGAIRQVVLECQRSCSKQLLVVEAADAPDPFTIGFGAHAHAIHRKRAPESRHLGNRAHIRLLRLEPGWRNHRRPAQLFCRKLAVEIEFSGDRFEQQPRVVRPAGLAQAARLPVDPDGLFLCGGRHVLDGTRHQLPVAGAQAGARHPLQIFIGQLNVVHFVAPRR